MAVPLLIFDLDGTLVDTRLQIKLATQRTRLDAGLEPADDKTLLGWFGMHPSIFFPEISDTIRLQELVVQFRLRIAETVDMAHPYTDVVSCLTEAKSKGFHLAVATTKPTALARLVLEKTGLDHYFDAVQGTDDFPPKPAPDVFLQALRQFSMSRLRQFWAIGDRVEDVIGANAAGLRAVAIKRPLDPTSPDLFLECGAEAVMSDLSKLLEFIEGEL